jgi:HK97 family phage prohead protease/HK97 family phage major capsid protein
MIRLQVDVAAIDTGRRLIEGTAVPYGEPSAPIAGNRYRFHAGALRRARDQTPFLLGHDENAPVGVVSRLVDGELGAQLQARIDRTADGDTALEQAKSGSRGSISIGFELEKWTEAADGVLDVHAATLWEASLVPIGAFAGALVERVAAQLDPADEEEAGKEEAEEEAEEAEQEEEAEQAEDNPDQLSLGEEEEEPMDNPTAEAEHRPAIITAARHEPIQLAAGEFVRHLIAAQHGHREAISFLRAALTESISTDVSGLLPPTYERTVIGGKSVSRPLYTAFRSRALPGVGLNVNKPVWTTHPDGAWAATVDADATSTKVVIGSQVATVQRWDWAGAIPWVVVQRSDPSIVDEIYGEAVQDWYLDVEAKVYGELGAAPSGTATSLGAAIAEFYTATGAAHRSPEVIVMAPDVWGKFADASALNVALGAGGVSADPLATSFAGIPAIVSGTLPAGETILATRRAVDARVTEPVRLTANAIGALNVELAVVGEGLFDTDYPAELLRFAAIVPTIAGAAAAGSSRKSG